MGVQSRGGAVAYAVVLCAAVEADAGMFEAGAADRFNITPTVLPEGIDDFVALVVPELQRRGLFRTEYEGRTLRENLDLPRPVSRYAARPARHRNVLMLD